MKIETIDVKAKEWFDKINGNSYFAGEITVNFGMRSEKTFKMPFQYGYGEQYLQEALNMLKKGLGVKTERTTLWSYCDDNKITLRRNIQENCKQKELKIYE